MSRRRISLVATELPVENKTVVSEKDKSEIAAKSLLASFYVDNIEKKATKTHKVPKLRPENGYNWSNAYSSNDKYALQFQEEFGRLPSTAEYFPYRYKSITVEHFSDYYLEVLAQYTKPGATLPAVSIDQIHQLFVLSNENPDRASYLRKEFWRLADMQLMGVCTPEELKDVIRQVAQLTVVATRTAFKQQQTTKAKTSQSGIVGSIVGSTVSNVVMVDSGLDNGAEKHCVVF